MKNIILIIALIAFVGCKEEAPTENSLLSLEESYLPLQVGNEWIYNYHFGNTDTTKYIKVIGTKNINNNDYFIVVDNIHLESDTNYIRTEDGLKYYLFKEDKESIFRIFKDTILENNTYLNRKIRSFKLKDSDKFYIEEGDMSEDAGILFIYSKNVGLVEINWFRGNVELLYANIDGNSIGDKP